MLLKSEGDKVPSKIDIDITISAFSNAKAYYDMKKKTADKFQKTIDASEKAIKAAERKSETNKQKVPN